MRRRRDTGKTSSIWRKSWAARLLPAVFLLLAVCGTFPERALAEPQAGSYVSRVENGWIGRFAGKDESIRKFLGDGEAWAKYRDMELFEAIRFFTMEDDPAHRVATARSCLELACTFENLDSFFLDVETQYLDDLGMSATPGQKARLGLCQLRKGKPEKAKEIFNGQTPRNAKFFWALGKAGIKALSGGNGLGKDELKSLSDMATKETRALLRVAAYSWGRDLQLADTGYYGQALQALSGGDLFGGMVALQMVERPASADDPGPDLYLYYLLKHVFARMAADAVKGIELSEAAIIRGKALMILGDFEAAEKAFASAKTLKTEGDVTDALLLYGSEVDVKEARNVALIYQGLALVKAKKAEEGKKLWAEAAASGSGSFEKALLAAEQAREGIAAPLADPGKETLAALSEQTELQKLALKMKGGETARKLLEARTTKLALSAAAVARASGRTRDALNLIDSAHAKKQGYKPSFVNPPSFLVDLSRAYAETGEFAPAVEIMFELSNQFSSSRAAYESLKRLYASTTGGEAPPR